MRQATTTLTIGTRGQGLVEVTAKVEEWVRGTGVTEGLLAVFRRHTFTRS